jgi:hypothetical protein
MSFKVRAIDLVVVSLGAVSTRVDLVVVDEQRCVVVSGNPFRVS